MTPALHARLIPHRPGVWVALDADRPDVWGCGTTEKGAVAALIAKSGLPETPAPLVVIEAGGREAFVYVHGAETGLEEE